MRVIPISILLATSGAVTTTTSHQSKTQLQQLLQDDAAAADDGLTVKDVAATMDSLLASAQTAFDAASAAEKKVSAIGLKIVQDSGTSLEFKNRAQELLQQVKEDADDTVRAASTATALVKQAFDERDHQASTAVRKVVMQAKDAMSAKAKDIWVTKNTDWNQLHEDAKKAGQEAQSYYDGLHKETEDAVKGFQNHAASLNAEAARMAQNAERERRSALWAYQLDLSYLVKMREADAQTYATKSHDIRAQAQSIYKEAEELQASLRQITSSSAQAATYEEFLANPLPMPDLKTAKQSLPKGLKLDV